MTNLELTKCQVSEKWPFDWNFFEKYILYQKKPQSDCKQILQGLWPLPPTTDNGNCHIGQTMDTDELKFNHNHVDAMT